MVKIITFHGLNDLKKCHTLVQDIPKKQCVLPITELGNILRDDPPYHKSII